MTPVVLCTRKYAKVLLTLTFVLVGSQYLFNALYVVKIPLSLVNLIGMDGNKSMLLFQRPGAPNIYHQRVSTTPTPELCPIIPATLKGHVPVNTQIPSWAYLEEENQRLDPGGRFKPRDCVARNRVAIIIPFRDREIHLKIFLQNLHPFLQRQQLDYGIYVVEIASDVKFNRALLMNVGFVEALKRHDYQCFIFHDVDLLPEDDRNLYTCPQTPRHMSVAIDRFGYKLPYAQLFGGVSAITREQFLKINGFSNLYFGWGGEDDDIYRRILYSNLTVTRYSSEVARYKMMVHKKDTGNPQRFKLLRDMKRRYLSDGLSSLNYTIVRTELKRLFTWILIRVDEKEVLRAFMTTSKADSNQGKPPPSPMVRNKRKDIKDAQVNIPNNPPGVNHLHGRLFPGRSGQMIKAQSVQLVQVGQRKPLAPLRRKSPRTIDWIPSEFNGTIPDYLNKYDHLKKIKKKTVSKPVAKSKQIKGNVPNKYSNRAMKKINDDRQKAVKTANANIIGNVKNAKPAQVIDQAMVDMQIRRAMNIGIPVKVEMRKTPIPRPPQVNILKQMQQSASNINTNRNTFQVKTQPLPTAKIDHGNVILETDAYKLSAEHTSEQTKAPEAVIIDVLTAQQT